MFQVLLLEFWFSKLVQRCWATFDRLGLRIFRRGQKESHAGFVWWILQRCSTLVMWSKVSLQIVSQSNQRLQKQVIGSGPAWVFGPDARTFPHFLLVAIGKFFLVKRRIFSIEWFQLERVQCAHRIPFLQLYFLQRDGEFMADDHMVSSAFVQTRTKFEWRSDLFYRFACELTPAKTQKVVGLQKKALPYHCY